MQQTGYRYSLLFTVLLLGATAPATAQIAGDGTLPVPTRVTPTSSVDFNITDGTQMGGNLFHSFSQFSVPTLGSAVFNTTQYNGIRNILSRVTGGSVSTIDGVIRIIGSNANLFLLNPNGILFGPNASLQLGGSFLATTSRSIRFADGAEFSANSQTPPLLTMSVPIGVQFGRAPGGIQVAGSSLNNDGNTIGLLGGDITITGGANGLAGNDIVSAAGGRVELGAVADDGFVGLSFVDRGFTLTYDQVKAFRPIQIIQNSPISANDGGSIQVQGSQIRLADGSQLYTINSAASSLPGGALTVNAAESVELLGTGFYGSSGSQLEFSSGLFNQTTGPRNAGTLSVTTKQLIVRDGAFISGSTSRAGQGGNVTVNASDLVEVSGVSATDPTTFFSGISVSSNRNATGQGGNLVINTNRLLVQNGGQISATTFGNGQGGNLIVNANDVQLIGGSASQVNGLFAQAGSSRASVNRPTATGQGGSLTVNTNTLLVQDGSRISTATNTAGAAGNLVINATGSVQVIGRSRSDQSPSLLTASSTQSGSAGNLSVFTRNLTLENGGQITVSGTGTGAAGNLRIDSPFLLLNNKAALTAETKAGQGNITINSSDLRLRWNSLISTNATGTAPGGNITISTKTLVALENSDITANAQNSFGGRVSISAVAIFGTEFRLFLTPGSDITATSALGPQFSGLVTIQTPGINPNQGLGQLKTEVVDVSNLVVPACSPGSQQSSGEFFITGRGGLPPSPTDAVGDSNIQVDLGKPMAPATTGDSSPPSQTSSIAPSGNSTLQASATTPLLQAQGWVINSAGKVMLVTQSPLPSSLPAGGSLPSCNTP